MEIRCTAVIQEIVQMISLRINVATLVDKRGMTLCAKRKQMTVKI